MKNKIYIHILLVITLSLLSLLASSSIVSADLTFQETDLAPGGLAYEANLDGQGMLWVSHLSPSQIWRFNTQGGGVTVYSVGGEPSDGRGDGAGALWWADLGSNRLSRLNTSTNRVDAWEIPGSSGLYTTAINPQGQVWVLDFSAPYLYRLDPATNQLCTYPLPYGGLGNYIEADGQYLWVGDYVNTRMVRLDPAGGSFKWWLLPENSYPLDLELDSSGNLWWTDTAVNYLGLFDPSKDSLTTFHLPPDLDPQMLSLDGSRVWFTFQDPGNPGGIGRLDPSVAMGTVHPAPNATQAVSPDCLTLAPSLTSTLTPSTRQASWDGQSYPVLHDQDGWLTFQSPQDGSPFGIANDEQVWAVDLGRSVLARLDYPAQVTACAEEDSDGDLATTDDRLPKPNWAVYLTIAGARQLPGKTTGTDGCATWRGLQPELVYGVSQDLAPGWQALNPGDHSFGSAAPNQAYSHTFIIHFSSTQIYLPLLMR